MLGELNLEREYERLILKDEVEGNEKRIYQTEIKTASGELGRGGLCLPG